MSTTSVFLEGFIWGAATTVALATLWQLVGRLEHALAEHREHCERCRRRALERRTRRHD